jgi:glycosyltransferase involved in cell wall biosynthesis
MIHAIDFDLSFVIPVHNMAGRLQNLEKSIESGKGLGVKFIIVHDFSQDSTQDELMAMKSNKQEMEIKLISGSFGSPGKARNAGIEHVETTYAMFADSDDVFYIPEIARALLDKSACAQVIIGAYREIDFESKKSKVCQPSYPLHINLAINPGIWRMIFETSVIKNKKFKDYRMAEDQLWLAEMEILDWEIELVDSIFYDYFANNKNSLTSNLAAKQDLAKVLVEFSELINLQFTSSPKFMYTAFAKLWTTSLLHTYGFRERLRLTNIFFRQTLRTPQIIYYLCLVLYATLKKYNRRHDKK